jgi:predicted TPR repeat methyltransferase
MKPIREKTEVLKSLTDPSAERNIYVHPNPLARDIFWQRLEILAQGLKKHTHGGENVIDFGGGSGAFLRGLCGLFHRIEVVDLDPQDALNLKGHYGLENCRIIQADIFRWEPDKPRDLVVATDVLEHFPETEKPLERIEHYLKDKGLLALSVPTENWLYRLGRLPIGKTKPADHYHGASHIMTVLRDRGWKILWETHCPQYGGIHLPLFHLAILQKPEHP